MQRTALIFCFLVLTACGHSTYKEIIPDQKSNFKIQKVIIVGLGMPMKEKKDIETSLAKSLAKYDVKTLRGFEVFPKETNYSVEKLYEIAKKENANAILIVNGPGSDVFKTYAPSADTSIDIDSYNTISYPRIIFSVQLKNAQNRKTVWLDEGFSSGNIFGYSSNSTSSFARKTVLSLSKEGLLP